MYSKEEVIEMLQNVQFVLMSGDVKDTVNVIEEYIEKIKK
jgi:hypothetical protein